MSTRCPQVGDTLEYEEDVTFALRGGRTVSIPTVFVGTVVDTDERGVTVEVIDLDGVYPTMKRVVVPWADSR